MSSDDFEDDESEWPAKKDSTYHYGEAAKPFDKDEWQNKKSSGNQYGGASNSWSKK